VGTDDGSFVADNDELVGDFLVESYENLDQIDVEMVRLETEPSDELLASIFRNLHTIKGTAGFFDFENLARVAHAAETLLSNLRSGETVVSRPVIDALLAAIDAIRCLLDDVTTTGTDGSDPYDQVVEHLTVLTRDAMSTGETDAPDSDLVSAPLGGSGRDDANEDDGDDFFFFDEDEAEDEAEDDNEDKHNGEEKGETKEVGDGGDVAEPDSNVDTVPTDPGGPNQPTTTRSKPDFLDRVETSVRVDVAVLDRLMNLVGELVLARNQVLQYRKHNTEQDFQNTSQQLDLITTELQEGVMKTRMQPIGRLYTKMPRVVRDLAVDCDKKVTVTTEGEETELDRTLLEAVKDPLTHLVRNAVDHGIENPADRRMAGKPETGSIWLRALHEGGQVIIEIEDDGAGLNLDAIRDKAIAVGLVGTEEATEMSDRDIAQLIFAPGLSTAKTVSNVSGRGVGMDVVRTNIEKIGGSIDILSTARKGTTITVRIPLTLAIVPALIVGCTEQRYLVSQVNLTEVLQLEPGGDPRIETAGNVQVLRLRDSLLPLVHLREVLGRQPVDLLESGADVAVLHADGVSFGLVVDTISDTEEIVVKPLGAHLKNIEVYSGTTIMGDGTVSLILDTVGIARSAGLFRERAHLLEEVADEERSERRAVTVQVLGCRVGTTRVGVPVALVKRIEEFSVGDVEHALGQDVFEYRGGVMRLYYLREALGMLPPEQQSAKLPVLVYEHRGTTVGIAVDEIIDVFEVDAESGLSVQAPHVRFSGILGRREDDLINIDEVLELALVQSTSSGLLGLKGVQ